MLIGMETAEDNNLKVKRQTYAMSVKLKMCNIRALIAHGYPIDIFFVYTPIV